MNEQNGSRDAANGSNGPTDASIDRNGPTRQERMWNGPFGRRYIERHPTTVEGFDQLRIEQYGTTQTELMRRYLDDLDRDSEILEVGCGTGIQLRILREMGFERLYGVDVQRYALEICRDDTPGVGIAEANVFALPFQDREFDLVFTNEMLITIAPERVDRAITEIARCTDRYVWGLEFYADEYTEIEWRGEERMLWKTDFEKRFREDHGFEVVESARVDYVDNDDVDRMYLLERRD